MNILKVSVEITDNPDECDNLLDLQIPFFDLRIEVELFGRISRTFCII